VRGARLDGEPRGASDPTSHLYSAAQRSEKIAGGLASL
jgi:hypothetical protein